MSTYVEISPRHIKVRSAHTWRDDNTVHLVDGQGPAESRRAGIAKTSSIAAEHIPLGIGSDHRDE